VKHGFVVFSINYRLLGEYDAAHHAKQLAAVHDARAAVRYLRLNAATYNLDMSRVVLGGDSSGCIATFWYAYFREGQTEGESGNLLDSKGNSVSSQVHAIVGISGTMSPPMFCPVNRWYRGDGMGGGKYCAIAHCTIHGADTTTKVGEAKAMGKPAIPLISIHGSHDCIFPVQNQGLIIAALNTNSINNAQITIEDGGHVPIELFVTMSGTQPNTLRDTYFQSLFTWLNLGAKDCPGTDTGVDPSSEEFDAGYPDSRSGHRRVAEDVFV